MKVQAQTKVSPFSAKFLTKVEKVNNKMLCSLSRGAENKDTWTIIIKGNDQ